MNSLIELTQTVWLTPARLLGQVEYSYSSSSQGQTPGPLFWIIWLACMVLLIAGCWKIFSKAGQPGWAAIIPIYNWFIWCKIVGRPGWWVILLLIPLVNFIIVIILCIDLAKEFWERSRVWDWFDSVASYFLSDSRLWQRAIPATVRRESRGDGCSTAADHIAVSSIKVVAGIGDAGSRDQRSRLQLFSPLRFARGSCPSLPSQGGEDEGEGLLNHVIFPLQTVRQRRGL